MPSSIYYSLHLSFPHPPNTTNAPPLASPRQQAGSNVIPSSLSRLPITSHSVATVSKATERSGCQAPRAMHVIVTYLFNSIFIYLFILNASALVFTCAPSMHQAYTRMQTHAHAHTHTHTHTHTVITVPFTLFLLLSHAHIHT